MSIITQPKGEILARAKEWSSAVSGYTYYRGRPKPLYQGVEAMTILSPLMPIYPMSAAVAVGTWLAVSLNDVTEPSSDQASMMIAAYDCIDQPRMTAFHSPLIEEGQGVSEAYARNATYSYSVYFESLVNMFHEERIMWSEAAVGNPYLPRFWRAKPATAGRNADGLVVTNVHWKLQKTNFERAESLVESGSYDLALQYLIHVCSPLAMWQNRWSARSMVQEIAASTSVAGVQNEILNLGIIPASWTFTE